MSGKAVRLVRLVPECEEGPSAALRYAETLSGVMLEDRAEDRAQISPQEFLDVTDGWCRRTKGTSFAVVSGGDCIGMISISRINSDDRTAYCGLFILREHRRRGFGRAAVERLADIARSFGVGVLRGRVALGDNTPVGFWGRLGAKVPEGEGEEHATVMIDIDGL